MKFTLLFLAIVSYSCTSPKNTKSFEIIFDAWNEDTVNTYHFVAFSDNRFNYQIKLSDTNGSPNEKNYFGKATYGKDSIILVFKGKRPVEIEPYLIVEASGTYLIQYIDSRKSRYFLRLINHRGRHH